MYLTDEEFTRLRGRFSDWKEAGYPDIDMGLAPLLEAFNTLPGVVTVFSCMGHFRGTPRVKIPFYVYMGVTQEGQALALQVFHQMLQRMVEIARIYQSDLVNYAKGSQPSYSQVPPRDFQLTCGVVETKLSEEETLTYYRVAFIAKGTHLGNVKNNFLAELIGIIERTRAEASTSTVQP